jgi:hypothetical protein
MREKTGAQTTHTSPSDPQQEHSRPSDVPLDKRRAQTGPGTRCSLAAQSLRRKDNQTSPLLSVELLADRLA